MHEIVTIGVPPGTRNELEALADAEKLTLSQYVRRALDATELLGKLETARLDLLLQARAHDIYTDEDVFQFLS